MTDVDMMNKFIDLNEFLAKEVFILKDKVAALVKSQDLIDSYYKS